MRLGAYYYKNKEYDKSCSSYRFIVENWPSSDYVDDACYWIALSYFQEQDYERAKASFKKVVENYPESELAPESSYMLGEAEKQLGQFDRARQAYNQTLQRWPGSNFGAQSYLRIAQIEDMMGQKKESKRILDEIVEKYPYSLASAEVHLQRGEELFNNRNYQTAIEEFKRASEIAHNETGALAQKRIGDCYQHMRQYYLALTEYLKTVYLFGQFKEISAEAQYMAGLMQKKTGKTDEARQAFEKVISNYPGSEWAEKAKKEL